MKKSRWLTLFMALMVAMGTFAACQSGDDSTGSDSNSGTGNSSSHEHSYVVEKSDNTYHWTECECGEATEKVAHVFADMKDETHHWTECECGTATEKVAHVFTDKKDETHHWEECECGAEAGKVEHTPDPNGDTVITDETHAGTCVCGTTVGATAHEYNVAKSDETYHWEECSCGKVNESTKAEHNYALAKSDETYHWTECECGKATDVIL